jgi:uncharacterized protein YecE (DUF72 family)
MTRSGPFPRFALFDDLPAGAAGPVAPASPDESLLKLGRRLPRDVYLGTSSWSFPGWERIVYGGRFTDARLARDGLSAYATHPVLRAVGIDRGFYQPLAATEFARFSSQVPENFRFVAKAPALVTSASKETTGGATTEPNPQFLDATAADELFVQPALRGLGPKAGPLVFQISPLPRPLFRTPEAAHALIDRFAAFFAALPRAVDGFVPLYAVELRDPELLTPRFVRMLRSSGVRLCLGVHARMPEASRQAAALHLLDAEGTARDDWRLTGPLVVRWNLHAGYRYDDAKTRYAPFDRIIDADIVTRGTLAHLIHVAQRSHQPAYVIVNNKAEGSAPLSCIELARAVVGT